MSLCLKYLCIGGTFGLTTLLIKTSLCMLQRIKLWFLTKLRGSKAEATLEHPVIKRKCRAEFNEGILKVFLPLTPSMDSAGKVH
ncbi:hypothetical protein CEXT_581191 [Caerostris extrusa]|uniref:SHSP domain-containing protein n=1 Tax=Caerostris extrusa TaxID=172846 RepID=A0AAV4XGA2_CAEEX|nr:hypothetical protein CEXT_581191 [Caerostris extrusa]